MISNEVAAEEDQRLAITGTAAADALRDAARDWVDEHVPASWLEAARSGDIDRLREVRPMDEYREWYPTLAASGMVAPTWPREFGGLGLTGAQAKVIDAVLDQSGLVRLNVLGLGLAGPTVLQWGTDAQKRTLLWPTVTNEAPWCQLFSEPSAGSDLASLATRAVREGDDWIVTGQKVWTSFAQGARYGMLLARTDPDVPKHAGITYFVCDLHAEGVEVRPLRQITGDAEFNEVFLDEVRIPDSMRLGAPGQGWAVAKTTLMNERVAISGSGGGFRARIGGRGIDRLIATAIEEQAGTRAADSPFVRRRIVDLWIESNVIRLTNQRARDIRRQGGQPGPEGSIGKLLQAEHNQRLQELALELLGRAGAAYDAGDEDARRMTYGFLRSQANTIEGGTSAIQRNILAERILGLPKDPGIPAADTPWSEIPRGG